MPEEEFNPTTDGSTYKCSCKCKKCDAYVELTPLEGDQMALTAVSANNDGLKLSKEAALEMAINLIAWATDKKDPCVVFTRSDDTGELEQETIKHGKPY